LRDWPPGSRRDNQKKEQGNAGRSHPGRQARGLRGRCFAEIDLMTIVPPLRGLKG
jgi:hypothetical protein